MTHIYRQDYAGKERDSRSPFSRERSSRGFDHQQRRELAHEDDERRYGGGGHSREDEVSRSRAPSFDEEERERPYRQNYYGISAGDTPPWEGFTGNREWRSSPAENPRHYREKYGPLDDRYLGERGLDRGYYGSYDTYRANSDAGRGSDPFERNVSAGKRVGPKNYTRSDARMCEEICDTLTQAYELEVGDVSVEVKEGKVTLEGTVPQRYMKHRIEDIADRCAGVREVENTIRVKRASDGDEQTTASRSQKPDSRSPRSQH